MADPPPSSRAALDAALDGLVAIYRELDHYLAALGVACRGCGQCCDFARNDFRLYASRLELELVLRRHPPPRLTPQGQCGYLLDGRCSIYDERPLGCRTYFCDPAHAERQQGIYHTFIRRIRAVIERHGLRCDYQHFFGP